MKNIRAYKADKYSTSQYEEIEPNIYKTYIVHQQTEGSWSLQGVSDEELANKLRAASGWEKCDGEMGKRFLFLMHEGKNTIKKYPITGKKTVKLSSIRICTTPTIPRRHM